MLKRDPGLELWIDGLVMSFEENTPFSVWFNELNTHNKRNLAILLNNQTHYVDRLTEVMLGNITKFDVLDFVCQEYKKLAYNFPTNILALPNAVSGFNYYDLDGNKQSLLVRSQLYPKGDLELSDTLKNKYNRYKELDASRKFESFYVFPLLLWTMPIKKESPLFWYNANSKPQDYWHGEFMYINEGQPKEDKNGR